jgi:ubiquinone/menaquinone biosynthesis C-methylase UbiE
MKRAPTTHGGVFTDETFAREYAVRHWKMAEGLGRIYGRKLKKAGFTGGRILDAGCGFGATNLVLARAFPGSDLVGVDLSDPLLALAREKALEEGLAGRVRFQKADVQEIPFEDGAFDVVLNLNMVHLVSKPLTMLAELERVLKPGGSLFVADLRRSVLGLLEKEIRSALSAREARELIRASALRPGRFSRGLIWWRFECITSP